MKLEIEETRILLIPENETEHAYLKWVLKLKENGNIAQVKRVDAYGADCCAYLEITAMEAIK